MREGQERRRRLRPHPGLQLEPADRLRRRLLELHDEAAAEQPVRPHHLRCRRAPPRPAQPVAQPQRSCASTRPLPPAGRPPSIRTSRRSSSRSFPPAARRKVRTPWVSFPGEYTARCESSGNATWLQVTHIGGSTDRRPLLAHLRRPGTRPPHPRRQHRTRQPRPTRPRRGRGLPPPVAAIVSRPATVSTAGVILEQRRLRVAETNPPFHAAS